MLVTADALLDYCILHLQHGDVPVVFDLLDRVTVALGKVHSPFMGSLVAKVPEYPDVQLAM